MAGSENSPTFTFNNKAKQVNTPEKPAEPSPTPTPEKRARRVEKSKSGAKKRKCNHRCKDKKACRHICCKEHVADEQETTVNVEITLESDNAKAKTLKNHDVNSSTLKKKNKVTPSKPGSSKPAAKTPLGLAVQISSDFEDVSPRGL